MQISKSRYPYEMVFQHHANYKNFILIFGRKNKNNNDKNIDYYLSFYNDVDLKFICEKKIDFSINENYLKISYKNDYLILT